MIPNTLEHLFSARQHHQEYWNNLHGCAMGMAIASECVKSGKTKLIICEDNLKANEMYEELCWFAPELKSRIHIFPDWETLPYDLFSPHQDIISSRLSILSLLKQSDNQIIIGSVSTFMTYLCPSEFIEQHTFILDTGQRLDIERFRDNLVQSGYYAVPKVLEHGEFAVRGGIFDVFPMGAKAPVRIELFDDEIESLRYFDPESQRSTEQIDNIRLLPARECPLTDDGITKFRRQFREVFQVNPLHCPVYQHISEKQFPAGIEYYIPLFYDQMSHIFEYIPKDAELFLVGDILHRAKRFYQEALHRFEQRRHDVMRPILDVDKLYCKDDAFIHQVNQFNHVRAHVDLQKRKGAVLDAPITSVPDLPVDRNHASPLHRLLDYVKQQHKVLLLVESAGRREVIHDLLKEAAKPTDVSGFDDFLSTNENFCLSIAPLADGCVHTTSSFAIVTEKQLFGGLMAPQQRKSQKAIDPDVIIKDLAELKEGDPVVHLDFGIGRFQGLKYLESQGQLSEFLVLQYAGDDKIYVPVSSLHLISRYSGSMKDNAPLHKLGSEQWQKDRQKAFEKIHDVAVELLDIYARREASTGFQYSIDEDEYKRFCTAFPFIETEDQINAINAIIKDMKSTRPMDRLICGDVGFGKTEVAMRAAYVAAQAGRQVCVLVPTTLLAGQHFDNFKDRFADFPVTIELLSRFRSAKETTLVLSGLKSGAIDIVIGTHKLLQKDIEFKQLGLLIIDEEHRFGVKQKEHIKKMRSEIDILSMTATPIPRTLNMAMSGIRDVSLITTPPAKRLSIKTFLSKRDDFVISEAILREILRGGQVFFLHNDIDSIVRVKEDLEKLVPEARVGVAHGQMRERQLEQIMSDFYHHRFNVLVCTTIIETGIDIPTANTIIIDRADKFGLAQLHQLRGRVGRSHHQAYAYLITPDKKLLTKDAIKRLEAIVSLEDLGAGFNLASHDMEIRGAGELLGDDQSGNMEAIGFGLYMDLLEKAVNDLKSGKQPELSMPLQQGTEIELGISAIIPEDYVPDVHIRLSLYKKIASAQQEEDLHQLQVELIDRFGLLPDAVKHLILIHRLRAKVETLGIKRISRQKHQAVIEFSEKPNINPEKLIKLIQLKPKRFKLNGPNQLNIQLEQQKALELIHELDLAIDELL